MRRADRLFLLIQALRLARVKQYRSDKGPDQADTMATVQRLYESQRGASAADAGR